jgi:DNA-binding CsgD family transcriptional regulator
MSVRTVLVAHHEALVAEGLTAALSTFRELAPVAPAFTPAAALAHAGRVDAVALDARFGQAARVAATLRAGGSRVVMIGGEDVGEDDVVRVQTDVRTAVLAQALAPGIAPAKGPALSDRQRRILDLASRGMTAQQMARHLGISTKTIEQHKSRMFRKLGVPNQAAAVRAALDMGLPGGAR